MKFSYFTSVKSASGIECTPEVLLSATHDPNLMSTCSAIAYCTDADQRGKLKKQLPIITWQAYFPNGSRKNAEAIASGLFMLDIDHVDEPNRLYYDKVAPLIDELGIMVVHKTPSTKGLRIVAKCHPEFTTIAENQQWLAGRLGLQEFDEACNDLARASYLVPEQYFYYRDGRVFTDTMPEGVNIVAGKSNEPRAVSQQARAVSQQPNANSQQPTTNSQQTYKGIALSDIALRWLENHGGTPGVGERNTVLYQLATRMRYITDFNPRAIFDAIPHCDLPTDEVMTLCQSACSGSRAATMPWDLRLVINSLQTTAQQDEDKEEQNNSFIAALPPLPIGIADSLENLPSKAVMPVLCGIMPLCMTYATNVSYIYCDGATHRLNSMAVIYGEQGSGKGIVREAVDIWLKPLLEADKDARAQEEAYKEMRKNRKKDDELPPEPKVKIRYVPITVSCSALLKRMINADGNHIYSFGEELDTLRKTNKAGAWSEKSDCYRLGFDNGIWGQDYLSENSITGLTNVAYNFTVLGTPGAVHKCFPAVDTENGMCSRVLFAEMIHSPFEYLAERERIDNPEHEENIMKAIMLLQKANSKLTLPRLSKHIARWCNDRADEARICNDKIMDTFRKRAAVIAFRCAVVYHILSNENENESDNMLKFAEVIADYCLYHQCKLFGEQFLSNSNRVPKQYIPKVKKKYFESLDLEFTFDDIRALRSDANVSALRTMLCRWKQDGLIEEIERNHWRKLA